MTLFEDRARRELASGAPLAARMRPRTFDEFVGQRHVVGPESVLRRSIEADRLPSVILWGPPGTGKTTLATLIASLTSSHFERISGVASGVADLRRIAAEARERLGAHGERTLLFVDEIHRFNKAQQDVILPYVEDGTFALIGATTENPSFEVVSPLLSRARVFALDPLTDDEVAGIAEAALSDRERGLGDLNAALDEDALAALVNLSNGDARSALNALELAVSATPPGEDGARRVTQPVVEEAMQRRSLRHDKAGDLHYDTISAFIKSVRASDPDAAVYWLARMLEAGEDPLFVARRLVVLAAEDIGMAAPMALGVAVAAQQAVHFIGMPEGRIPLAEATIYPGDGAEEQRGVFGHRAGHGGRAAHAERAGAAAPPQRAHGSYEGHGLRQGLPLRPRIRGPLHADGEPAGQPGGPALLRRERPGVRARGGGADAPLVGRGRRRRVR